MYDRDLLKIKLKVLLILSKGQNRRDIVHLTNACAAHLDTLTKFQLNLSKQLKKCRHPASTRTDGIWGPKLNFFENSSQYISLLLVPLSAKGKLRG